MYQRKERKCGQTKINNILSRSYDILSDIPQLCLKLKGTMSSPLRATLILLSRKVICTLI